MNKLTSFSFKIIRKSQDSSGEIKVAEPFCEGGRYHIETSPIAVSVMKGFNLLNT